MQIVGDVLVDPPGVLQDLVLGHPYQRPVGKAANNLVLIHPACGPNTVQLILYEVGALSQIMVVPATALPLRLLNMS